MKIDIDKIQVLNSTAKKESFQLYKLLKSRIFLVALLFTGLCSASFMFLIVTWEQNQIEGKTSIQIPKGETLRGVTNILKMNKIINSEKTFMLAVKFLRYERSIQAGNIILHKPQKNYKLINQLVYGAPKSIKITILEGWTYKKIAKTLSSIMEISEQEILALCKDRVFIDSLGISAETLEGFLFPDTYYFLESESPKTILIKMVSEYKSYISNKLKNRMIEIGLTELEMLTIASIIEGEAIYDDERKNISSVYHNRIKLNMKLQADPTIQYIIDDGPRRLLNKDLSIQSPYNTYLHKGLPPGPINNPGFQSIFAALYPEKSEYIYFVAKGDGYHTFSKTKYEHDIAKKKFDQIRKKIKQNKKGNN